MFIVFQYDKRNLIHGNSPGVIFIKKECWWIGPRSPFLLLDGPHSFSDIPWPSDLNKNCLRDFFSLHMFIEIKYNNRSDEGIKEYSEFIIRIKFIIF